MILTENFLAEKVDELQELTVHLREHAANIEAAANLIVECFNNQKKILFSGNGGSAAEAQHMAAEYVSSLTHNHKRKALSAIALNTDTSILTACGNDYGFDTVFERQIEALGNKGDVLIAISTSGNSKNILLGILKAKEMGLKVIGLTGRTGGEMKEIADILIRIASDNTARIQECHLFIEHTICEIVEYKMFGIRR